MSSTDDLVAKFWAQQGKSTEEQENQQSEAQSAAPAGGSGSDMDDLAAKFWAQQGGGPAPARQPDPAPAAVAAVNALTAGLGRLRGSTFNRQSPAPTQPAQPAAPAANMQTAATVNPRAATTATLNRFRQSEIGNQLGAARAQQQAADQELKNSWLNMLGYVPQPGLIPNAEQAMQQAQAGERLAAAMQSSRDAGAAVKQLQEDANRARHPEIYRYEARRDEAAETQREVQRLQSIVDGSTGVKQDDGSIFLPDGTILAPGQAERELKVARDLLDVQNKTAEEEFARIPKGQQLAEKNPALGVAWSGLRQGFAGLSRVSSGVLNALFGKDGVLGWFAQEAGGMFADGVNNLLHMDLIDAEKIRSGDWNPISKLDNANRKAVQQLQSKAVADLGHRDGMVTASQIVGNTIQMLPLFYLQAYAQALPAASGAAGTTGGVQYAANLGTATSGAQQANIMFNHAARMMAQDPATQYTFLQSFGSSYNEAKEDGADNAHAIVYALLNASINTGIEMGGGIERLPAEMHGVETLSKRGVMAMADSVLDEVKEEVAQGFFEKGLKAVYQDVDLYSDTDEDAMINPGRMGREALMAGAGTMAQIPVQRAVMGSMALLGNARRGRNGGGISTQVQEAEARRAVEDASPYRETGEGNAQAAQETEYTRADFDEDAESEEAPTVTAATPSVSSADSSPEGGAKSGETGGQTAQDALMGEAPRAQAQAAEAQGREARHAAGEALDRVNKAAPEARQAALNIAWNAEQLGANDGVYDYAEAVLNELGGIWTPVTDRNGTITRYTGLDANSAGATRAASFAMQHPETAAKIREELERRFGGALMQASQKAAGAPTAQEGTEIAESPAEAPTEAPALLNSEQGASAEEQAGTETGTTLPPAEQAPSLTQGGQETARQTADREAERIWNERHPDGPSLSEIREADKSSVFTSYVEAISGELDYDDPTVSAAYSAANDLCAHGGIAGRGPVSPYAAAAAMKEYLDGHRDRDLGYLVQRAYQIDRAQKNADARTAQPVEGAQALADAATGRATLTRKPAAKTAAKGPHIDQRNAGNVGSRSVKAFQAEHPEIRPFYAKAARYLQEDIQTSLQSDMSKRGGGRQTHKTPLIDRAMREFGLTRSQALEALQQIIDDNGAENNAAAKRMELLLDDMLTNGYWPVSRSRETFAADADYLEAKGRIEGGKGSSAEEYRIRQAVEREMQNALLEGEELTEEEARARVLKEFEETGYYGIGDQAAFSSVDASRATDYDGERNGGDSNGEAGQSARPDTGTDPGALAGREAGTGAAEYDGGRADGEPGRVGGQNRLASLGVQARAELTRQVAEAAKNLNGGYLAEVQKLDAEQRDPVLNDIAEMLVEGFDSGEDISAWSGDLGDLTEILGILEKAVNTQTETEGGPSGTEAQTETEERRAVEDAGPYGEAEYTRADFDEDAEQEGPGEDSGEPELRRSQTESNTLQHIADENGGQQEELYYVPISERQSLGNAINRVNAGMDGEMQKLMDKEMWTGEDIDTALTIQGLLQTDGVRTGDFSAAQAWGRIVQSRGTRSGQALQAFSKWTRSGAAAASEAAEQLGEAEDLPEETRERITNDIYDFASDFDSIEDGDLDGIRDLIKRQARYRNTWTFGKKGFERYLNEIEDFDYLREYALRQMMNIPADYTEQATLAQKVKTWQVNSMLSRLGTFFRNFGGNGVFGVQDTISQDAFGVALDALVGRATGRRTVGFDRGWLSSRARKGARHGLVRSILEVAGDVDMMGGGSRYGTNANRTFKMTGNAFDRFMSRWEQLMGYSLTSSDRFFRGGIEAEQQRGLERFENLTEQERQEAARNVADYRLFQNQDLSYRFSKGVHDALNVAGFGGQLGQTGRQGGFGLGDLVNTFPGVPANLWAKPFEYSPANVVKGAGQLIKLLRDVHSGNEISVKQQQDAVMNVARGLHGSALFVALAAMFKAGLFKNADDEDDPDAKALANAEGRQGVQINLTAAQRWLDGKGSAQWQKGDELMKIDWLEPMNAFLSIASLAADDFDDPGALLKDYAEGSFQAMMDMPVMQNIAGIFDTYNYSKAETTGGKILDTAVGFGTDALTGMLPAPISQAARAMDPYYRETVGENATDTAKRRVMNAIPGVRELLPEKLDNFGRPKRQASSAYDRWMNSFVRPGQITDYKAEDVDRALDEFAARTGEAVYPKRKAPNSFTADKEKIILSGEEKQAYQKAYGEAARQYYGEILLGEDYRDLSDGEKQWLLDTAEGYAAYQAKKAILEARGESYSNDSWDKVDALEDRGGDPLDYLLTKQSLKQAVDGKDFDAVDALLADFGKHDDVVTEALLADVSRLDDRAEAYEAGIKTATWERAYEAYRQIENAEGLTKQEKAIKFAQYLDSGKLSEEKQNLLREQFGYYNIVRADTSKFDKLDTVLDTDRAAALHDTMKNLEPLPGSKGVTQNQKILTLSGYRDLSEKEKWSILQYYVSDSCYKKAMDARAKGQSFDEWAMEYTKGK